MYVLILIRKKCKRLIFQRALTEYFSYIEYFLPLLEKMLYMIGQISYQFANWLTFYKPSESIFKNMSISMYTGASQTTSNEHFRLVSTARRQVKQRSKQKQRFKLAKKCFVFFLFYTSQVEWKRKTECSDCVTQGKEQNWYNNTDSLLNHKQYKSILAEWLHMLRIRKTEGNGIRI